jgi:exodeoxyribonuclease-3
VRITTWNVNGLRAAIGKGLLESVTALNCDVLCLQEIKARPEQIEESHLEKARQSYSALAWNPARRPGYSGTATWARVPPLLREYGLGAEEFDQPVPGFLVV